MLKFLYRSEGTHAQIFFSTPLEEIMEEVALKIAPMHKDKSTFIGYALKNDYDKAKNWLD